MCVRHSHVDRAGRPNSSGGVLHTACTPFSSSGRSGALRASSSVLALLQSPRCGGIHASARVCCVGGVWGYMVDECKGHEQGCQMVTFGSKLP